MSVSRPDPDSLLSDLTAPVGDVMPAVFDPHGAQSEQLSLRGKVIEYALVGLVAVFIAGYEWLRTILKDALHPMWMTALAACFVAYCTARIALLQPRLRALKAGRHFWELMALDFSRLGEKGYFLFDGLKDSQGVLLGPVLAGPSGVYSLAIRTNPPTGRVFEKINHLDGSTLRLGRRAAFADPLGQARLAARRVGLFLQERGIDGIALTPMLIFPGWKMGKSPSGEERDVLVANEKTLAHEVLSRPAILEPKEIQALCEIFQTAE